MAWGKSKYKELGPRYSDYRGEYGVWINMKRRCYNKKSDMYPAYGGRGITVCDRWLGDDGFINFYRDMGSRPTGDDGRHFQIDRINNDAGYSPNNCRWVHPKINARNRSDSIKIAVYGDEYNLQDLCKMFGFKRTTISEAVRLGRATKEEALERAFRRKFGKEEA